MSDPNNVRRGKNNKRRGSNFEREIVNAAKAKFLEARRVPLSGALAHEKGDVIITPAWSSPLTYELKRRASLPVIFNEIGDHTGLIVRADGQEALVVVRLSHYLDCLQ